MTTNFPPGRESRQLLARYRLLAVLSVTAASVSLVLLSGQASSSEQPSAVQRAFARWETGKGTVVAESEGYRSVVDDAVIGRLASLRCGGATCIGASFAKVIGEDAFLLDPGMTSATLTLTWNGTPQTITWEGEGAPSASIGDPAQLEPSAERAARAEGEVFERGVGSAHLIDAFLEQGDEDTTDQEERTVQEPTGPLGRGVVLEAQPYQESLLTARSMSLASNDNRCITYRRTEKRFARLINEEREKRGLGKLRLDTELGKAARKHTGEMVAKSLLFHTSSSDLAERITRWRVLGENVGVGGSVGTLHTAFMESPPHKENVLHETYRYVGIGTSKSGGSLWVTMIFEARKDPGTTLRCA